MTTEKTPQDKTLRRAVFRMDSTSKNFSVHRRLKALGTVPAWDPSATVPGIFAPFSPANQDFFERRKFLTESAARSAAAEKQPAGLLRYLGDLIGIVSPSQGA